MLLSRARALGLVEKDKESRRAGAAPSRVSAAPRARPHTRKRKEGVHSLLLRNG